MKRRSYIDIDVVDNHVRLRCGQISMHSEEYHDSSTARRAARNLVDAINTRPMRLSMALRGKWVVEEVRKVWMSGSGKTVVLPVNGGPDQARQPFSEPV